MIGATVFTLKNGALQGVIDTAENLQKSYTKNKMPARENNICRLMKININILQIIICLCFALSSCTGLDISDINVIAPENVPIQSDAIRNIFLTEFPLKNNSGKNLEITVYDCSLGKERLIYNSDGTVTVKTESGYMKLLCVVKKENRLVKTIFIEASGKTPDDMAADLIREAKKSLR